MLSTEKGIEGAVTRVGMDKRLDGEGSLLDRARPLFETPPPVVSEIEAAVIANRAYGLVGKVRRLTGERDTNFLIESGGGQDAVLKFINAAESDTEAEMQAAALDFLAKKGGALRVPGAIPSLDGRPVKPCHTASGLAVRTRCYSYLPGAPAASRKVDDSMRRKVGRTVATVLEALRDFSHPAAGRLNLWNLCEAGHLLPLVDVLPSSALSSMLAEFLRRFQRSVMPRIPSLPHQAIHNDLSPSNMLVGGEAGALLSVVDFGDMIVAPALCELAVAASYQISPASAMRDLETVIGGFVEIGGLNEEERSLILDFVLARLAGRILIARWRADIFPDNRDYILRSSKDAQTLFLTLFPIWREGVRHHEDG